MPGTRFLLSTLVLSLSTAWAGTALADVPPADACSANSAVGAPCNNAGSTDDQPGTCQSGTCTHATPEPDGGFSTSTYACMICTESSSSSSGGGSTTSSSTTTSSGSTPSSGGSSCTVGAVGREGAFTGSMLLVGLAALLAERRSRGSARSRRSRSS